VSTHGHGHGTSDVRLDRTAARVVVGLLLACAAAVVTGAVLLWPQSQTSTVPTPLQAAGGGRFATEAGTVRAQATGPCGGTQDTAGLLDSGPAYSNPTAFYECTRTTIAITSGPDVGRTTTLEIPRGPGSPVLQPGDQLRLARGVNAEGATRYDFYDFSRGLPLAAIAVVFAAVVVAVARWRGLASLVGLAVAVGVMAVFVLPALLAGESALPVAVVGGAAILFAVIYLAHGVSLRTSAALLGTLASLGLSAGLSALAVHLTHLTGQSEEQNTVVQVYAGQVSIVGLLLAGFVIGSLGVLNDVTVTQASTAFELAALDPDAPRRRVYAGAMRVGRDHIASSVYTLVLAYVGSALPLLLLFSIAGRSITDVLTGDVVAVELVRALVGGIALVASVPLTTAIAVVLARPDTGPAPVPPTRTRHHRRS
jgi:uncharacterized membrane protein